MNASHQFITKVLYSQYSRTFNFLITRLLSNLFLLLNRFKILLCTNFKKMYSLYGYNLVQNLQQSRASMIISFNSSAAKWQMHFNLITLKIVMDQVPKIWFANTSQIILEQAFYTFLAIYLIDFQSSVSKIISVAIWRKFWQIKKCFRYVDSFQLRRWYF